MALFIFARFEPRPGKERQLYVELTRILEPTRAEAGCVRVHLYESTREPAVYYIHSEWVDEAAFEAHAEMPHMKRFLGLASDLLPHAVRAERTTQIG